MASIIRLGVCAVALTGFGPPTGAQQGDEALDRTPVRCVSSGRVQRMEPVDDRTILFFMRGERIYRNSLREECRDLQYAKEISYIISGGGKLAQVCDGQPITIKERQALCALGEFHPISAEEAQALAATDKR